MRLLAALFGNVSQADRTRFEESATETHVSASVLEALQMSHGDLAQLLRSALRTEYPGDRTYVWTRDVYDDSVVYEVNAEDQTRLFQRSYTVTDGAVTLGEPMAVIAVTQYVKADQQSVTVPATPITQVSQPAEEAAAELTGDLVPLVETAVKTDGTATIKIIAPGQGSSGFYPADVLKRDGPKAFGEGLHVYLDHPSATEARDRPERSVKDLAGSLTGAAAWQETGVAGPGLYAPVKFIDSVAPHINAIAPISGMSIRAAGKTGSRDIGGQKVRTIESIDVAHSVDVVTQAGAGGKVVDLIESARSQQGGTPPEELNLVDKETADKLTKALEESNAALVEAQKLIARLQEQEILREARILVAEKLAAANLPKLTRERLTESLVNGAATKDGKLDAEALTAAVEAAITSATAELAEVAGGNPVRGMGSTSTTTTETPKLEESRKRIDQAIAVL